MGKDWVALPDEQVFLQDGDVVISGPLPGLASEGINIRAERTEAVSVASLFHDLDMNLQWVRSADVVLAKGFGVKHLSQKKEMLLFYSST